MAPFILPPRPHVNALAIASRLFYPPHAQENPT